MVEPIYIYTCTKILQNTCVLWCRQLSCFNFFVCFFLNTYSQAICEWPDHLVMLILTAVEACHCFKCLRKKTQTITGKNAELFASLFGCERQMEKTLSRIIFIHIWEQYFEWKGLSQVGTALYLAYYVFYFLFFLLSYQLLLF